LLPWFTSTWEDQQSKWESMLQTSSIGGILPWLAGFWWALILLINIVHECTLWVSFQVPFQTYPGTSCVQQLHINATPVHGGSLCRVTRWFPTTGTVKRSFPESEFWLMLRKAKQ
jgi:hypothetical protein